MKRTAIRLKCQVKPVEINGWLIAVLPPEDSLKLPSRGQVYADLTLNSQTLALILQPDGRFGHWFRADAIADMQVGVPVTISLTTRSDWPEPSVSDDVAQALKLAPPKVQQKWLDITPMARWEWMRWINATSNLATRANRIEKTISKLNGKHRRPCCFNIAACTEPHVAKNAQLAVT